jgi:hypothetical protein
MRKLAFAAVIIWATASLAVARDCAYDRDAMMAMDFAAFDQTLSAGWRSVGDIKGCEAAAADLILDYRTTNAAALVNGDPQLITGLNFHEAQLRASAGQTSRAIQLFQRSVFASDDANWYFLLANLAFLQRDREGLLRARDQLAALPQPPDFAEMAATFRQQFGRELIWPLNLRNVDSLIACFDRSYREATSETCQARP